MTRAELEALAGRVEMLPSRKLSALAGFGAWSGTMLIATALDKYLGASETLMDLLSTVGIGLAFAVYWELRIAPVSRLTDALRAHAKGQAE